MIPHHSGDLCGRPGPSVPVDMARETSLAELRTFFSHNLREEGEQIPLGFGSIFFQIWRNFGNPNCNIGWRLRDTAR